MIPETMLASIPAADAVPLAAPAVIFHALMLTSVLHLLAMNLLVGGAMVVLRDRLRAAMLTPSGDAFSAVVPQWDVMLVFTVCLIAAVGLVAWMTRAYLAAMPGIRHGAEKSAAADKGALIQA